MDVPIGVIYALAGLWTVVCGGGVVLLAIGLRGRQADRLGRCRACGYVIHGGFDPGTCPECGTDIRQSGLRFGRREILTAPLMFGLMLLALGSAPIAVLAAKKPKQVVAAAVKAPTANPTPYAVRAASDATASTSDSADASGAKPTQPRIEETLPAPERGLLDSAGSSATPSMITPADLVTDATYHPSPGDATNPRSSGLTTSAEGGSKGSRDAMRSRRGVLDAAASAGNHVVWSTLVAANPVEIGGGIDAPTLMRAVETHGPVQAPLLAAPLARFDQAPSGHQLRSVTGRIEPERSSAAQAWIPQSVASHQPDQWKWKLKSTAVRPARVNAGKHRQ